MKSIDFTHRKIWIGNNPELLQRVIEKLSEHGITVSASACCKLEDNPSCLWISSKNFTFGTYGQNFRREDFEKNKESTLHTELTVQELLEEELAYEIF